jgi:hypothetical protein
VAWHQPPELTPTPFGRLDIAYRIHVDPSVVGANFALAIGHTELAPCDRCGALAEHNTHFHPCKTCTEGMHWPHVFFDRLHAWRPRDFEPNAETGKREIDYLQVERELDDTLYTFPSTTKFSSDQCQNIGLLQHLRQKYSPAIRVIEETATEKSNFERAEKFKSAVNLGWLHAYKDSLYEDNESSLLELECKFLTEKNRKIYKQDFGPVQTKDLYDAVSVVATDLLHEALERWSSGRLTAHAFGSSNVAGLKSGRELERAAALGSASIYRGGHRGSGGSWEQLDSYQLARRRGKTYDRRYSPDRAQKFR